tara:strand:+ start:195 stop:362 length:168 start_codon:yes stop_codon:yes gene_type:complete
MDQHLRHLVEVEVSNQLVTQAVQVAVAEELRHHHLVVLLQFHKLLTEMETHHLLE